MARPHILIVSPASSRENNGNWQTASRWRRHLGRAHRVAIAAGWQPDDAVPDLLIALHARRSAAALAAFKAAHPDRPALLVLTGTDLYRDIDADADALASLALADALVVLQPQGLDRLGAAARARAHVIYQSAPRLTRPRRRPARPHARTYENTPEKGKAQAPLDVVMIGHLRHEKDPLTFMRAGGLLGDAGAPNVRLLHVGAALDPVLGEAAHAAQAANPRYRWLGALPHAATRRILARSHAMVIASTMEGGANVIIEAVTSNVPVLASDIGGNRGMLGEDYAGYFAPGDAAALAALIARSVDDARFERLLRRQCAARARLFAPETERARLLDLVDNLLSPEQNPIQTP